MINGRWAGKCENCQADCYEDYSGEAVCSECGLISNDPSRILEQPIELDFEVHNGLVYYDSKLDPHSFKGEAYLTTLGRGSACTVRDEKPIHHFCHEHGSYVARPIWWTDPNNSNARYWFCLKCQKAAGVVDYPPKWTHDDLVVLNKLHTRGLYGSVRRYLRDQERKSEDQIDPNTNNSLFHYQQAPKSDRYLKTAVWTALAAIDHDPYHRISKGGRQAGKGADSIARWCRTHFAPRIPLRACRVDDSSLRGTRVIVFNVNSIRKILRAKQHQTNLHDFN